MMSRLDMLTRSQFEAGCKELIATDYADSPAAETYRGWTWMEHPRVSGLGCLSRTVYHFRWAQLDQVLEASVQEDEATTATGPENLICRQYVTYAPTFQTPAFYFSIHDTTGAPLSLSDLVRTTLFRRPFIFEEADASSFGLTSPGTYMPLLSQGEHPTLGTACWYLHPCGTERSVAEVMTAADSRGERRWLEAWFMIVGTAINTRLT